MCAKQFTDAAHDWKPPVWNRRGLLPIERFGEVFVLHGRGPEHHLWSLRIINIVTTQSALEPSRRSEVDCVGVGVGVGVGGV